MEKLKQTDRILRQLRLESEADTIRWELAKKERELHRAQFAVMELEENLEKIHAEIKLLD